MAVWFAADKKTFAKSKTNPHDGAIVHYAGKPIKKIQTAWTAFSMTDHTKHGQIFKIFKTGNILKQNKIRAVNSVGECYLHTVEVVGSNPIPPTRNYKGLHGTRLANPFFIVFFRRYTT